MVSTTKKVIAVGSATVLGPVVAPFVLSFLGFTSGGKKQFNKPLLYHSQNF